MFKRMFTKRWFVLVVGAQVLFLLGLAGSYHAVLAWGQEIRLETAPVDPRDLFYGDYVILNYEINTISTDLLADNMNDSDYYSLHGKEVYVILREDDGIYRAESVVTNERQVPEEAEAVLRGKVKSVFNDEMRIDYNLDRYYVPEGTGMEIETRRDNMIVKVKIAPWGQAVISGLEWEQ